MYKKMQERGLVSMLIGLAATLLLAVGPARALQPVNPADGCGQTLPKVNDDGSKEYVLTGDLTCAGAVSGIIITASDVVFHLAGHTISNATPCGDLFNLLSVGIFVQGGLSMVHIDGGTVSGFNDGIVLFSSVSRVRGMTVTEACVFGILVSGTKNQVDTNVVTANKNDGIALVPASNAVITSNDTSGNVRAGIVISDVSDNNVVKHNISNNNGGTGEGYGVAIFNGTNNLIENNVANKNDFGIRLSGAGGNHARRNTVNGSAQIGILITADGAPSAVRRNTVLGSGLTDMSDDSAGCDANTWQHNTFQTDLVAGASDGGPGVGCIR